MPIIEYILDFETEKGFFGVVRGAGGGDSVSWNISESSGSSALISSKEVSDSGGVKREKDVFFDMTGESAFSDTIGDSI